tara:strand:- start:100 stop:450 length:351 start_codon:yes stop_codon:yes gene_type:complete
VAQNTISGKSEGGDTRRLYEGAEESEALHNVGGAAVHTDTVANIEGVHDQHKDGGLRHVLEQASESEGEREHNRDVRNHYSEEVHPEDDKDKDKHECPKNEAHKVSQNFGDVVARG